MIRLVRVELRRLRARRAVVLLVAACLLLPALIWVGVAWNTRPVSAFELAQAQEQVDREREDPSMMRFYERCLERPERFGVDPGGDVEAQCDQAMLPQVDWYVGRAPLSLADERTGSGYAVIVLLSLFLVLIGTTFAGHDWNSRSMSNQLLFEPRRPRVWAAKGVAVLITSLVVSSVVTAAYWGSLWLLAGARGVETPAHAIDLVQGVAVRGFLFASVAALGAYGLTMLFRSTVATIGVLFALAILTPLLLTVIGFSGAPRWMPQNNVAAVLNDGITYYDDTVMASCGPRDDMDCGMVRLSLGGGLRYCAALLVLALVPSVLSFQRRDVP